MEDEVSQALVVQDVKAAQAAVLHQQLQVFLRSSRHLVPFMSAVRVSRFRVFSCCVPWPLAISLPLLGAFSDASIPLLFGLLRSLLQILRLCAFLSVLACSCLVRSSSLTCLYTDLFRPQFRL